MQESVYGENKKETDGEQGAPHRYHVVLSAEHFIFSDERDKYEMLRRIAVNGMTEKCRINGFILLDNELHLLFSGEGAEPYRWLRRAFSDYRLYCLEKYANVPDISSIVRVRFQCRPVHEGAYLKELLDLHLLCVAGGYAKDLNSFWWSSYQTYRGAYRWSFVCETEILDTFSKNRQTAQSVFRRLQRQRYTVKAARG